MRTLSSVARAEVKQALALNIFRLAAVGTWAAEVRTDGLVPGLDRVFASNAKLQDLWSVAKMGMWDDPPRDGRQTESQRSSSLNANFTHDVACIACTHAGCHAKAPPVARTQPCTAHTVGWSAPQSPATWRLQS